MVYANLKPEIGDVDIGLTSGVPLRPSVFGDAVVIPISVNTGEASLESFVIEIETTATDFTVTDCTVSNEWSKEIFICNIDTASGKISLVGSAVQEELIGEAEIASITLSTLSTATTSLIYTQVSSIVLSDGATYSNEASVAGTTYVKLNGARRRSLLSVGAPKDWVNSNVKVPAQHMAVVPATTKSPDEKRASHEYLAAEKRSRSAKRTLLQDFTCSTNVQGDVNGDCKFDANDYLALMRWIAGSDEYTNLTSTLGDADSFQRKQVDPTMDWMRGEDFDTSRCAVHGASGSPCPELRDAQFLLKVLEGDYRFLFATSVDDIIVLPESPYDSLTFQAQLFDYAGTGVSGEYTRVRFESVSYTHLTLPTKA